MNAKNNNGFSYVEMLMVLAIMAIMIGMVTISIGLVGRTNVSRTSEKLESLVNKARTNALTKGKQNGFLNVVEVDGAVYAYVGEMIADDMPEAVKEKGEKLCSADLEIKMVESTTTADKKVHRIGFKQSTGGLLGGSVTVLVKKKNTTKTSSFSIYNQTGKTWR